MNDKADAAGMVMLVVVTILGPVIALFGLLGLIGYAVVKQEQENK